MWRLFAADILQTDMTEYTKEQFWKLYEKLPAELKEAVFSDEVGDHILDACAKNGVADKVSAVA